MLADVGACNETAWFRQFEMRPCELFTFTLILVFVSAPNTTPNTHYFKIPQFTSRQADRVSGKRGAVYIARMYVRVQWIQRGRIPQARGTTSMVPRALPLYVREYHFY